LKARLAAAADGDAALAAERVAFDSSMSEATAALVSERESLMDRYIATDVKERELKPRRERISVLYRAWQFIGEDAEVCRGFKAPQFDALTKALQAHGKLSPPNAPPDAHFSEVRPGYWSNSSAAAPDNRRSTPPPQTRAERRRAHHQGVL
jgi:hypothetical protein